MMFIFIVFNESQQDIQFVTRFRPFLCLPQSFDICKCPIVILFISYGLNIHTLLRIHIIKNILYGAWAEITLLSLYCSLRYLEA